jgi:hypothetical protein
MGATTGCINGAISTVDTIAVNKYGAAALDRHTRRWSILAG